MRRAGLVILVALAACASPAKTVRLDEMSAEDHRREAARERARADDDYARYHPTTVMTTPGAAGPGEMRQMPIDMFPFNPTGNALRQAEAHLRHAREHDAAAGLLEHYENVECGNLSAKARAACPSWDR